MFDFRTEIAKEIVQNIRKITTFVQTNVTQNKQVFFSQQVVVAANRQWKIRSDYLKKRKKSPHADDSGDTTNKDVTYIYFKSSILLKKVYLTVFNFFRRKRWLSAEREYAPSCCSSSRPDRGKMMVEGEVHHGGGARGEVVGEVQGGWSLLELAGACWSRRDGGEAGAWCEKRGAPLGPRAHRTAP